MARPHLHPVPSASSGPAFAAEAELVGFFTGLVETGRREEESPDFDWLEAAVDGQLDEVEEECFASRLAGDPVLEREYRALLAVRAELQAPPAPHATAPRRSEHSRRWFGYAAAALLVVGAGVGLRLEQRQTEQDVAHLAQRTSVAAAPAPSSTGNRQIVFADSFEGGDAAHWSN